jgi:propionyl-CoA carboxylase alpha chain
MRVQIDRLPAGLRFTHAGAVLEARLLTQRAAALTALMPEKRPPDTSRRLLSPMPGLLASIAVAEGQPVSAGQELAVVEAMKMENVLRAERDATVKAIHARPGDSLAVDQMILEFA